VYGQEATAASTLESNGLKVYLHTDNTAMRDAVVQWYYKNPSVMAGWNIPLFNKIVDYKG
jgi:hypothetical protein